MNKEFKIHKIFFFIGESISVILVFILLAILFFVLYKFGIWFYPIIITSKIDLWEIFQTTILNIKWLNENQGLIAIIGLLLAWFGIVLPTNNSKKEQIENQKMLFRLLLLELWQNMNFAYQLEVSYRNNKVSAGELIHIPNYPPRYYVLEKIISPENLKLISQSKVSPEQLLEIYAQIKMIDKEFIFWEKIVMSSNFTSIIREDGGSTYELASSKLLELVDVLMKILYGFGLKY
jgi:hypothetical protein